MAKKLKIWNGSGHGKYGNKHIYVAAYSQNQAAQLVSKACYDGRDDLVSVTEIRVYYSPNAWGKRMDDIIPHEPCVYVGPKFNDDKPIRII